MIDNEKFAKIEELTENTEMLERLVACESVVQFTGILTEAGIECDEEETKEMYEGMMQAKDKASTGELSEDDLEDVNGGITLLAAACCVGGAYIAGRIGGYIWAKKVKGLMG